MKYDKESKKVTPDQREGRIEIYYDPTEGATKLEWKDNQTNSTEEVREIRNNLTDFLHIPPECNLPESQAVKRKGIPFQGKGFRWEDILLDAGEGEV